MPDINDILNVVPRFEALASSPIGLGMAALGRPGYINLGHEDDIEDKSYEAMRQHAHQVLDEAYQLGIRYFDTAVSYGAGERFLGDWVFGRGFHARDLTVASKWGYTYTADWHVEADVHEIKEHSLDNLNRSLIWSCLHLGRPLCIYQIHSATFESGVLENTAVLNRLAEIKQDGRLIGLTVSGAQQAELIDRAMEITIDGNALFGAVQATWNLLETSAGQALARAKDAGLAVIVKEVLANGRLTGRDQSADFSAKRRVLQQHADKLQCSLDALSIAAAVNQPWSDVVLSGASNIEQLRSNMKAMDVAWQPDNAYALYEINEDSNVYWQTRSRLKWN
jgi:aryl-alcohol dehydrogenase-like predicted oxidoreductase